MELILNILSYDGAPPGQPNSHNFGTRSCSIGRQEDNDLVLDEEDVSRNHALINFRNGSFYIKDASTYGTRINDSEPVGKQGETRLSDGDIIHIGLYDIQVRLVDADVSKGDATSIHPVDDSLPSNICDVLRKDPFESPLNVRPARDRPSPIPSPSIERAVKDAKTDARASGIGSDTWGDSTNRISLSTGPALEPGPTPQPKRAPKPEPAPEPEAAPAPHKHYNILTGAYDDAPEIASPFQESGTRVQARREKESPVEQAQHAAEAPFEPVPKKVQDGAQAGHHAGMGAPGEDREPAPAIDSCAETEAEQQEAIAAFMKGIGLEGVSPQPDQLPALMETVGKLLRTMTLGLIKVVENRDLTKSELHLDTTRLSPVGNNQFKVFARPDAPLEKKADEALQRLLLNRDPTFQEPVDAAAQSFERIGAHEAATLATLLAALREVLVRLSPETIEQRIRGKTLFETLIPTAKKARCWDLLEQEHAKLEEDGKDDFKVLLRQVAEHTYEDAIHQLRSSRDLLKR